MAVARRCLGDRRPVTSSEIPARNTGSAQARSVRIGAVVLGDIELENGLACTGQAECAASDRVRRDYYVFVPPGA